VPQDFSLDIFADQVWGECCSCGLVQLMKLVPLNVLYSLNHNAEVVGETWKEHHLKFADFINYYEPKDIIEVGASHGHLANLLTSSNSNVNYTMIDPNLGGVSLEGVKRISGFIENHIDLIKGSNVVMSHVFEHLYSPGDFLKVLSANMRSGDKLFLSTPQILEWLKIGSPNALNFEHTYFLSMDQVEKMLSESGFTLIQQVNFKTHSFFSVFEKLDTLSPDCGVFVNNSKHKKEFLTYIDKEIEFCQFANDTLLNTNTDAYLYGASLFGQALLSFGLKEKRFKGVLDNSKSKNGERLYGSNLVVMAPEELSSTESVTVVMRMGPYQNEIREQLKRINQKITILE
jgi:2-polyprenyl-3-methyl-5-hydroxy-6-metoxy-1,4-benzoquinol methylase